MLILIGSFSLLAASTRCRRTSITPSLCLLVSMASHSACAAGNLIEDNHTGCGRLLCLARAQQLLRQTQSTLATRTRFCPHEHTPHHRIEVRGGQMTGFSRECVHIYIYQASKPLLLRSLRI
ncbi:hypothetical protein INR49_008546 [Caranx melampygus]|nr:hypothetical protein INR49_008546 [Caranx melampygus]